MLLEETIGCMKIDEWYDTEEIPSAGSAQKDAKNAPETCYGHNGLYDRKWTENKLKLYRLPCSYFRRSGILWGENL
jgi:hypothetical protein